jgi:hypothetical protein
MNSFRLKALWLLAPHFAIALLVSFEAFAQSGSSTLTGLVKDATQGTIPGAQVSIINEATSVVLETVTNENGVYRVAALVPGQYRVEIVLSGFQTAIRSATLEVGQTLAIDVTLEVEGRSESIDVVATGPLVESQSSNVAQTVTREMLAALPLPNRAASSLASLAPGVLMVDTGAGTAENYPVFSVAGGRVRNQQFTLDGGNVTNAVGLTRAQQLVSLPVDAMQEFRIISNNYAAEFGHSTGGVITMSTRSGTNELHGSIFESHRNDALDSKSYFAASKPDISLNQFGGTLGGPIQRGRTFFFGTWERTRQLTGQPIVSTVPTAPNRLGDFSDLRDSAGQPIQIYDPATRQPFAGNVIPAHRLDPVALAAIAYYPLPNRAGTAAHAGNYVGNNDSRLDRDILVGKVDHQLAMNDRLTVRYYLNDSGTVSSGSFGNPVADPDANSTDVRVQSILAAHTRVFGQALVNDVRVTYLRRTFIDQRAGLGADLAGELGLQGVSDQAFPALMIPGYVSLSNANLARYQTPITDTQILNALSWSKGKHAAKFGFEFRAGGNSEVRDRGSSGVLSFSPLFTSNLGAPDTGNALATFLLGEVNSGSVQISDRITTRAQYLAGFAQDDWRVSSRLTLNYGVRYDVELPRREIDNKMNSFDTVAINPVSGTPGIVTFAGRNGVPERAFATDWNNIGPRFGFAYQLNESGRTVARGGAGVVYGQTVDATIGDAAALGFSTSASFVVSQPALQSAFRLRDGFPAYSRSEPSDGLGAVPVGERPNTSVAFFNPDQVAPTSYQSNLSLQHEMSGQVVLEVGYVGNQSRHLTAANLSLNQVTPVLMGPGNTQVVRPFPQFSDVVWINPSIGRSSYHSGFVRVQKRFDNGFSMLAHYTRSRLLDDVGATAAADDYGSVGGFMDAYHRERDWAAGGTDVPDHFVLTVLYEVPRFSTHDIVNAVLGSWRLGVLQTLQSGPAFTVTTTANTTNAFPAGPLRPDLIDDPALPASERTLSRWFNTAAFANPAPFTFGNSPRSVLRGPGVVTTDLTVEKSVPLAGRTRLDVRVEAYNLLNRTNFNLPGSTLGAADFGVISSARQARTVQLGARVGF